MMLISFKFLCFVSSEDSDNEVTDDLVGDKRKVFEFLNTSSMNELSLLSGCSQKKAEAIMAQRPFKGWVDMVRHFLFNMYDIYFKVKKHHIFNQYNITGGKIQ